MNAVCADLQRHQGCDDKMSCFYSNKCRDSVTFCQEIYSRIRNCIHELTLQKLELGEMISLQRSQQGGGEYSFHRRGKEVKKKKGKRQKLTVRIWQQSSNLETLGGRKRSLRGLYVSEQEREGDHRPTAAQRQEPPPGDKDTCDFNSLLLSV